MRKPTRHLWLVTTVVLLAACSQTEVKPYAASYLDALPRYPGAVDVEPAWINRFVDFFSHTSAEPAAAPIPASDVYANTLYFSDTLVTSEDAAVVHAHLERMRGAAEDLDVEILDRQTDGQDVYLVWRMTTRFTPLWSPVTTETIGVSHLRFNAQGRIVLQQDFWDAAAGFYEPLPVIGSAIRWIRGRFRSDD